MSKSNEQNPVNADATTTATTNKPSSLLDIAEAVLKHAGRPCHHTTMQELALELFGEDRDIATPVWRLCKKDANNGRFLFLKMSVYGLVGRDEGKDPAEYAPDKRNTHKRVMTPDQIRAEIERLQKLLEG